MPNDAERSKPFGAAPCLQRRKVANRVCHSRDAVLPGTDFSSIEEYADTRIVLNRQCFVEIGQVDFVSIKG